MTAHRYFAILVLVTCAIWVLTGEFSSVGSATAQDNAEQAENVQDSADDKIGTETDNKFQTVGVAQIPNVMHARTIRISGVTEADKITRLTARENGVVRSLAVRQGQTVTQGDTILTLDPEGRDANVRSARQLVEQRKAEAEARQDLVERGTIAKLQMDQTLSALRAAEADLEAKKAELDRLAVTAPYDGVIDTLDVEIGTAVSPGAPVATLIALDPIIGRGEVNEADLPIVEVGASAQLRLVDGRLVDGTIRYISRQSNPTTRTYSVEVEVPNPDLKIPSGMTVEVVLKGQAVSAKPVPRSIVTLDDSGALGVRGVGDDSRVVFYPIDLVDDGTDALLLAGIPDDALLVVVGQNLVADGQKVEAVAASAEALEQLAQEALSGVEEQ